MVRLRWRLDFKDKPSIFGVWNEKTPHKSDKIWSQNKKDLIQVTIEAEDIRTKQINPMVSLGAWDFVTMTVEAYTRVRAMGRQSAAFAGLSLISSKWKVSCWVDGKITKKVVDFDEYKSLISNI
jgi:hypothetical protein